VVNSARSTGHRHFCRHPGARSGLLRISRSITACGNKHLPKGSQHRDSRPGRHMKFRLWDCARASHSQSCWFYLQIVVNFQSWAEEFIILPLCGGAGGNLLGCVLDAHTLSVPRQWKPS